VCLHGRQCRRRCRHQLLNAVNRLLGGVIAVLGHHVSHVMFRDSIVICNQFKYGSTQGTCLKLSCLPVEG
jgi:hypothetical protein